MNLYEYVSDEELKTIPISEIFYTIQGEGALIGRPTVFVRTGGCDFRCAWCDTLYAVLPEFRHQWPAQNANQILEKVLDLTRGQPILITLSGGNPALQPLRELIEIGRTRGFSFALETQGSVAHDWFSLLDYLVLSPKPPSSQMKWRADRFAACIEAAQSTLAPQSTLGRVEELGKAGPQISLKIVVFDDADYQFAREVHTQFPALPVYLQVGNPTPALLTLASFDSPAISPAEQSRERIEWLLECVKRDGWLDVIILPQLHVLLWGNRRGV